MLAISGLRPVKNNYSIQNANDNSNFRKAQFQSNTDSVSFKANSKSDFYIASYKRMHSAFLGDAFKQAFDVPFNKFLNENHLCVKYSPIIKDVRVEKNQPRGNVETFIGHLQLLGQDGNITPLLSVDGLTKNDINVRLMRVLSETKTDLKISDEFKTKTLDISKTIDRFWGEWTRAIDIHRGYDANAKARDLQIALSELMPEK